jgi:hypothetical protein
VSRDILQGTKSVAIPTSELMIEVALERLGDAESGTGTFIYGGLRLTGGLSLGVLPPQS